MPYAKNHKLPEVSQNLNSLKYSRKHSQDEQNKNQKDLSPLRQYVRVIQFAFSKDPTVWKQQPRRTPEDVCTLQTRDSIPQHNKSMSDSTENMTIPRYNCRTEKAQLVPDLRAVNHIVQIQKWDGQFSSKWVHLHIPRKKTLFFAVQTGSLFPTIFSISDQLQM